MNQVTCETTVNTDDIVANPNAWRGSIWKERGELAMFAQVDERQYCMVDLKSGNRWGNPSDNIARVIERFTLVTRRAKITVESLP